MYKPLIAGSVLVSLYVVWPSLKDWVLMNTPLELLRHIPTPRLTTVGLINRANDCFANANIQALAGCPNLYLYLHRLQFLCPEKKSQLILLSRTLHKFIAELNEPVFAPKSISVGPIIAVIEQIHQKYLSRSQHDAHEMLHLLLETINLEVRALSRIQPGVPPFIFEGSTVDTIECQRCGYNKKAKETPFLVLTLTVPQQKITDVQSLIRDYLSGDSIHDYNCPRCQIINYSHAHPHNDYRQYLDSPEIPEIPLPPASSTITKSSQFKVLPESLAIHLNRSIYSGGAQRNPCKLVVPEYLELRSGNTRRKYKLCSLLRHSGTHSIGHYESARRKNLEFWRKHTHQFSDTDIRTELYEYSSSIRSDSTIESTFSSKLAHDSNLPFPTPSAPQSSVQTAQVETTYPSHTPTAAPESKIKYKGPKFWSISDTVVKENTLSQAVGKESSNYLVFYEKIGDTNL